jgi:hypothetical protein
MGWGFCPLQVLVINIKPHHSIKTLELLAVNHYCAFDRVKGRISEPALKVMDLHGLLKGFHILLGQSGMTIVLIHMGSAVLVKHKIPLVTTVVQTLQGQKNFRDHGVDLVPPKELVMEGTPGLTPVLLASKLLDVLPCA